MINLEVFRTGPDSANIEPLSGKRQWMDDSQEKHAYRCFPLSLSNQLGWAISFPEDITFMWDGQITTSPDNVKVLQGEKYCSTGRGNATISFNTNLTFRTDSNHSLLSYPAPNHFVDGATPFTTIMSTSFFEGQLPVSWRITRAFHPITIKAGEPIIAVMPISLTDIHGSTLYMKSPDDMKPIHREKPLTLEGAIEAGNKAALNGGWTDYYRDAVDYMGNKLGEHEVKSIKLKIEGV
jgi:hypothetical protein